VLVRIRELEFEISHKPIKSWKEEVTVNVTVKTDFYFK